jgi:uncharacterized membrane protein
MSNLIRFLQALILVLWLGGMIFFGSIVAPSAFEVMPTRQLAGTLVGVTLYKLNYLSCILLAIFILLALLVSTLPRQVKSIRRQILVVTAIVALAIALYSWFGIDRRMHFLRTQLDAVEKPVAEDPMRAEFDRLHRRSVTFFGMNVVLGLLMLGMWTQDR